MFRYVIECPNCGVIYRSRQYWYGNQDPVDTVVRTEIKHIWPGVRETSSFICLLYVFLGFLNIIISDNKYVTVRGRKTLPAFAVEWLFKGQ